MIKGTVGAIFNDTAFVDVLVKAKLETRISPREGQEEAKVMATAERQGGAECRDAVIAVTSSLTATGRGKTANCLCDFCFFFSTLTAPNLAPIHLSFILPLRRSITRHTLQRRSIARSSRRCCQFITPAGLFIPIDSVSQAK